MAKARASRGRVTWDAGVRVVDEEAVDKVRGSGRETVDEEEEVTTLEWLMRRRHPWKADTMRERKRHQGIKSAGGETSQLYRAGALAATLQSKEPECALLEKDASHR